MRRCDRCERPRDPELCRTSGALHLTATNRYAVLSVSDTPPLFPLSPTRRYPNGGTRSTVDIERRRCVLRHPAGWSNRRDHRWRPPPRTPALRSLRRHFGLISRALPPPMMTRISAPFATDAFVTSSWAWEVHNRAAGRGFVPAVPGRLLGVPSRRAAVVEQ